MDVLELGMAKKKRRPDGGEGNVLGSEEMMKRLRRRLQRDLGSVAGNAILRAIIEECGGLQLRLPDMQDIYRTERDEYIRRRFRGDPSQYKEFASAFGLHVRQVQRIIQGEYGDEL